MLDESLSLELKELLKDFLGLRSWLLSAPLDRPVGFCISDTANPICLWLKSIGYDAATFGYYMDVMEISSSRSVSMGIPDCFTWFLEFLANVNLHELLGDRYPFESQDWETGENEEACQMAATTQITAQLALRILDSCSEYYAHHQLQTVC